jgi:hypothetical protein
LKSSYRIEDMPSSKRGVLEVPLYAALLTLVVSRRLLALVRRRLRAMADRIPEQRWAAVFVSVAHELLAAATHSPRAVRLLLQFLERVLLHEEVDPNAARRGLLASVEQRSHRRRPMGRRSMKHASDHADGPRKAITDATDRYAAGLTGH